MAKYSITSLLPRFNATRMVSEYVDKFYLPAVRHGKQFAENDFENAKQLAAWKAKVRHSWSGVTLRRLDTTKRNIAYGESLRFEVAANLRGLTPQDVVVELLIGRESKKNKPGALTHYLFESQGKLTDAGEHCFTLALTPDLCGRLYYQIRVYPHHKLLTHPFEMGMMLWLYAQDHPNE